MFVKPEEHSVLSKSNFWFDIVCAPWYSQYLGTLTRPSGQSVLSDETEILSRNRLKQTHPY